MYILKNNQMNIISGGISRDICYEPYGTVAVASKPGLGALLAILFTGPLGIFGVAGYQMGMRDAVREICGSHFTTVEDQYCAQNPTNCMKPKEKDSIKK